VRAREVRGKRFFSPDEGETGYDKTQVAAFLDAAGIRLAAMESADRPAGPLVSGAILAGWAEWADPTRFSTSRRREGYDTAEVDAFVNAIRDEFRGVRRQPVTWHAAAHGKQFTTTRPGYDVKQVDAFLHKAEARLAAIRATDKGAT
jgi:DivIVA domain-containing protein